MRLGCDVLAAAARLAGGRAVGAVAPAFAGDAAPGRHDRLEPGRTGQRERPGKKGGAATGPNPTDRGKPGTKRHIITDRRGVPLGFILTGANVHDSVPFAEVLDAVPPIRAKRGRPRRRPEKLHADKASDHARCRRDCRKRHIKPRIARRGVESKDRLGRHRWVVERTFAWINRFRRLTIRYERREDIHYALTSLACSLICLNRLRERF